MKTMVKRFLGAALLSAGLLSLNGQHSDMAKADRPEVVVSFGSHAGFWTLLGIKAIPLNAQVDVNTKYLEQVSVGFGYTRDQYRIDPFIGLGKYRENFRIRILSYLNRKEENVNQYVGAAAGVSIWGRSPYFSGQGDENFKAPSLQAIYGIRINLVESLSFINEIALGPPYAFTSTLAFQF